MISVTVDCTRGARIDNLIDRLSGKQWLWQGTQSFEHAPVALGASYDDHWNGGWDDLFPNDAPGTFEGYRLPDHGELWSQPWEVVRTSPVEFSVRHQCATVPASVEKTVRIGEGAECCVHYVVKNHGAEPFYFLFKLHPAIAVKPNDRILLPGGCVVPVDPTFSRMLGSAEPFDWPVGRGVRGERIDLSIVPPEGGGLQEFVYVTDLPEGWCGVRDGRTGAEIRIEFPLEVLPYCWLFMTYGGWRNHFTVVLEPCTNFPKELSEAYQTGSCASLLPQGTLDFTVTVRLSS